MSYPRAEPQRTRRDGESRGPGITGSVLLIIFKSLISLCFITCLIRISLNLKNDQKNRPHDPLLISRMLKLIDNVKLM